MHVVAQGAVFAGRLVFPQERSAFFGMAAVTIFVDRELLQRSRACGSVRVVAIAADNLVLPDRMPGYTERLCPDVLMAGVAHFSLGRAFSYIMTFVN